MNAYIEEHYQKLINDQARKSEHEELYTKWINLFLEPSKQIKHPYELGNGHKFLDLVETLTEEKVCREEGDLEIHNVANIEKGFALLKKHNVALHTIHSSNIAEGNHTLTLGLIWTLMHHYKNQSKNRQAIEDILRGLDGEATFNVQEISSTRYTIKLLVLIITFCCFLYWCKTILEQYRLETHSIF